MEDLNLNGLKILLEKAIFEEEYEKAKYIETLIKKRENEPISYEMDRNKQIDIIINEFDFEKVAIAMSAVNWVWVKNIEIKLDENREVKCSDMTVTNPYVDELIKKAYDLLKEVYDEAPDYVSHWEISTGGFKAIRDMVDGKKCLSLEFVFDEWIMTYDIVSDSNYH